MQEGVGPETESSDYVWAWFPGSCVGSLDQVRRHLASWTGVGTSVYLPEPYLVLFF